MANYREQLSSIFRNHNVTLAYAFGSMADIVARFLENGRITLNDPLTDIDIGVVFAQPAFLNEPNERAARYAALFNDLTEVFPENRLDLVFLQETHSVFQAQAIMGHCIYAEFDDFKSTYEERVLAKAADFRPFLKRYFNERIGSVS